MNTKELIIEFEIILDYFVIVRCSHFDLSKNSIGYNQPYDENVDDSGCL